MFDNNANVCACVATCSACANPVFNVFGVDEYACRLKLGIMGFSSDAIDEFYTFHSILVTEMVYKFMVH